MKKVRFPAPSVRVDGKVSSRALAIGGIRTLKTQKEFGNRPLGPRQ